MQSYSSNTSSAASSGPVARGSSSGGARGASKNHKDPSIGKTIVITSGQYKGYDANVIAATETHFEVELLAKLKKISIERSKTQVVGDLYGSLTEDGKRPAGATILNSQATPFMQGQTPSYIGQTPMHSMGSETPMIGTPYGSTPRGGDTPGHSDEFDPWKVTPTAYLPAAPSASAPSPWNGSEVSGYSGASGWAMGSDRYSPYSPGSASPAPSASSAPAKTGGSIDFSGWKKDFVVTFTAGAHLGELGVLQQAVQKDGSFYVTQMDSKGQLMPGSIKVHYSEMALADPRNGSQVIVVAGNKMGRTGAVRVCNLRHAILLLVYLIFTHYIYFLQRVVTNDVFLENKEMFKIFNLAWIMPSEENI
jgi:transcription elongation factor